MSDEIQPAQDGFDADVAESDTEADAVQTDIETPEADAVEQNTDLLPRDAPATEPLETPVAAADPADAVEQRRVVEQDEEDYR